MPKKTDKSQSVEAAELRRRAEARLKAQDSVEDSSQFGAGAQRLLHELQVHQVELEMQNAELRQARDELENALGTYTDLYDFAPVGYATLGRDGTIHAANLTAAALLGIERSRLLAQRFERFVAADDQFALAAFLRKVFTGPAKESCEMALLKRGKLPVFVQIEAAVAASGEECRVAIIDISARKQLEGKLDILHGEIAARAAELEAANIELEAFNYSVSHDLRGPLTIIVAYCDAVKEAYGNVLDEKGRGFIRQIHEGAMSMNRLIDTLLNFSCVKRIKIRHEKVDLSKMAEKVARALQVVEPGRRAVFRIAPGIVVHGDTVLLRVVLDNLIGNAWKFSRQREEAVIDFDVTEVDGKPAYFIRDNGPGFDMAKAGKLFVPFQRLPGSDVVGHGIGLATVDRVVRRHGGKVWAESQPGKGATFFFVLE